MTALRQGAALDKLNGAQIEELGTSIVDAEARVSGPCDRELISALEGMTVSQVRHFRSAAVAHRHLVEQETKKRVAAVNRLVEIASKVLS